MNYQIIEYYCNGCHSGRCRLASEYNSSGSELSLNRLSNCPCVQCIVKIVCKKYCNIWFDYVEGVYQESFLTLKIEEI